MTRLPWGTPPSPFARTRQLCHAASMLSAAFFVALLAAIAPGTAEAAPSCSISMQNVAFGAVDVTLGAPVDTTSSMQITCSGFVGSGGRLCINIDAGSSGDATSRKMLGPGAAALRYDLYTNAARTTIWGSWQTGYKSPGVQVDVSNGTSNFSVYGRVSGSQQNAVPGAYTSTFTAQPFLQYRNKAGAGNCPTSGSDIASSSFTVTATVPPSCGVATTNMNFGTSGLLTSNVETASTVTVTCTNTSPYSVSLSNGNTGTGPTNRKMVAGANAVTYGLYRDAARALAWGDAIGTNTLSGTGSGAAQALTVHGRVPPQTTPPPATYTDNVIVTVTY